MKENYMVVELPKNDQVGDSWLNDPILMADYDAAFDLLNEKLSHEGHQVFKRPRLNKPVRIALSDRFVELWIIRRSDNLETD